MLTYELCVCDQCDGEHGYSSFLYKELNKRAIEEFKVTDLIYLERDHPLWQEFYSRMKVHQVNCVVFDGEISVCLNHIESISLKLKEMNNETQSII